MEYKHNPPTLHELRETRKPLINYRKQHQASLSASERFAAFFHKRIGSMSFFFLLLLWTLGWLAWNIFAPVGMRFDPAPAFVIWLFASNILQLIFLPIIMVGQNIEDRAAEWRAENDFEINKKAEHEIEVIIAHLENQNEMLLEVMRKIDKR
jgi:uncharacterized membrane protein